MRLFGQQQPRRTLMLCIYRAKNAHFVAPLVGQTRQSGAEIRLWALDNVLDSLALWTCGSGAGSRMDLLNRLWNRAGDLSWERVVISDDDVVFTRGDLLMLVNACEHCEFGIAQPAHAVGSYAGRHFSRNRAFTIARTTSWVDVGPMVVFSGDWLQRVLPFPDQAGMGWGLGYDGDNSQRRDAGLASSTGSSGKSSSSAVCILHTRRSRRVVGRQSPAMKQRRFSRSGR